MLRREVGSCFLQGWTRGGNQSCLQTLTIVQQKGVGPVSYH